MKSLLVAVAVAVFIAAFEANCRELPNGLDIDNIVDGPVDQAFEYTDEPQNLDRVTKGHNPSDVDRQQNLDGVTEGHNPSDVDRQLTEVGKIENDVQLRGKGKNKVFKEILMKVDAIRDNQGLGCPSGFIWDVRTNQCFKFYNDTGRTWNASVAWCQKHGLQLAKPVDPIYIRQFLVTEYDLGSKNWAWIGAFTNGSNYIWQQDGQVLSPTSRYWYNGRQGTVSKGYYLTLMTREDQMKYKPYRPYYQQSSRVTSFWTLCELVMEEV